MTPSRLDERVTGPLADLIGKRLLAARYWPLKSEMTADDLRWPWHYLGGEVELLFDGRQPLRITWDENAGWAEHFSVQVVQSSAFVPASASMVWKPVVGAAVSSIEVFGFNQTPALAARCPRFGCIPRGRDAALRGIEDVRPVPQAQPLRELAHALSKTRTMA